MDPTKFLEADHRRVEELFDAIEDAEGGERQSLVDELATALAAHMDLEERILYPAMSPVTGDEAVVEGNTEHDLGRKALRDMVDLAPDEPGFGAAMDATKATIAHHVEEEEQEVFPELRKDGTILDRIATPFMTARADLGLPMDPSVLESASTKPELLAEANAAGVDGAASMTKKQLAEALAEVMAGG